MSSRKDWSASSARGQHTSIYRGLLSSRKFCALSPEAKLAFYTLKIRLPIAQIERLASWTAELADLTGLTDAKADAAIKELCRVGFCQFDGRTLWVVDGLRFDPSMAGTVSPLLAKGIRKHVAGLPDCAVTKSFKVAYAVIFPDAVATETAPLKGVSDTPSVRGIAYPSDADADEDADLDADADAVVSPKNKTAKALTGVVKDELGDTNTAYLGRGGIIRGLFPKRAGGHDWGRAEKHMLSQVRNRGVLWATFGLASERFAAAMATSEKAGTEFVKDAGNFFAPGGLWEGYAEDEAVGPSGSDAKLAALFARGEA